MAQSEAKSFCRICVGLCGMIVTTDEDGHITEMRGDRDDSQTLGFACFKGLQAAESHNSPDRILHPLKRMPDGSFVRIGTEQALDEIAAKIAEIHGQYGGDAIGGYKGGGSFFTSSASFLMRDFFNLLGSKKVFSPNTIDQSAKYVSVGRIGAWPAGRVPFDQSDVFMIVGGNPLVSVASPGFDTRNPVKRLKEAKARGMKLIIIDPRRSETAKFADLLLQPLPGEDVSVLAGLIRIILSQGWEDKAFVAEHVGDIEKLRAAVEPFTPDYVAARADVPADKLFEVADMFARQCRRGPVTSCTGSNMAPHSNLAEHLVETLNIVCGRYLRAGERIGNPGVLTQRFPRKAQVIPAARPWEDTPRSRIGGFGMIDDEMMTGIMADEMLEPGPGKIRVFINQGGNPASAVPDQRKVVRAFRSLDLLVSIEPFMTNTALLSHYIFPPYMQYERADLPLYSFETMTYPTEPYVRYTPAVAAPPANAELSHEIDLFWGLAKRLGLALDHWGVPIDMDRPPQMDDFLSIIARHSPISLDEIKRHPGGLVVDMEPQFVEPADPDNQARFTLMPDDVFAEMAEVAGERIGLQGKAVTGDAFTHRLAVRRTRELFNSMYRYLPGTRKRLPYNRAFMNPDEMAELSIAADDWIELASDTGAIRAMAAADPDLRPGVISISHGFGGLPDEVDYRNGGVSPNLLISTDRDLQTINAMPRMSAIPLAIRRVNSEQMDVAEAG
ncbi:molybdopterin-binding oxidoreductase [Sphingomonas sp. DBB INV C78]|uniref:molybdopterin-containing oxidoreductase family protein n=1 Tax=Sphingomonas sp. DBB INV C78 TaxID=3349434 RepID=UPI0036D3C59C